MSPDFDRWATGPSLLTGHHKMKASEGKGGGWGLRKGVQSSHMTTFSNDNTSKQGGSIVLFVVLTH